MGNFYVWLITFEQVGLQVYCLCREQLVELSEPSYLLMMIWLYIIILLRFEDLSWHMNVFCCDDDNVSIPLCKSGLSMVTDTWLTEHQLCKKSDSVQFRSDSDHFLKSDCCWAAAADQQIRCHSDKFSGSMMCLCESSTSYLIDSNKIPAAWLRQTNQHLFHSEHQIKGPEVPFWTIRVCVCW